MNTNMSELAKLAIATAIRKMFAQGHFNICTVDQCLKLAGIIAPRQPYEILHTLHCVNYGDMPRELAEKIPDLLSECFQGLKIDELMKACEPGHGQLPASALKKLN